MATANISAPISRICFPPRHSHLLFGEHQRTLLRAAWYAREELEPGGQRPIEYEIQGRGSQRVLTRAEQRSDIARLAERRRRPRQRGPDTIVILIRLCRRRLWPKKDAGAP
jgi:hypothetical protein